MARPYSLDLRERVVASVAGGRSCRATAVLFGVSVASVVKWLQRYRATGSAAAKPMGRRDRPLILLPERDWLLARLAAKPDLTLRGVQAELAARGIRVSGKAIWNFFRAEQVTFKKKPARRRAGSPRRGSPAGAMEEVPGPRRSATPGLHR
jgi:transposase